ncbi:MAG: hypothetical protein QW429_06785 [Thermoprotei archaeon]
MGAPFFVESHTSVSGSALLVVLLAHIVHSGAIAITVSGRTRAPLWVGGVRI